MRKHPRTVAALVSALVTSLGAGGCGGSSGPAAGTLAGDPVIPPGPAPGLVLKDSLGRRVDLRQFRGKAVVVTFLYTHCPDVCPLIAADLHDALSQLGPEANRLQLLAVSTDPRGDNPPTVKRFLAEHRLTGRMKYLIGTARQLRPVWARWQVISYPSPTKKGRVEHTAKLYGISASGRLTTVYPSNFDPAQIAHDVPLLASR